MVCSNKRLFVEPYLEVYSTLLLEIVFKII